MEALETSLLNDRRMLNIDFWEVHMIVSKRVVARLGKIVIVIDKIVINYTTLL